MNFYLKQNVCIALSFTNCACLLELYVIVYHKLHKSFVFTLICYTTSNSELSNSTYVCSLTFYAHTRSIQFSFARNHANIQLHTSVTTDKNWYFLLIISNAFRVFWKLLTINISIIFKSVFRTTYLFPFSPFSFVFHSSCNFSITCSRVF